MTPPLMIFETHPIQYRAPVYQSLQELIPNQFEVIYASDCSVRGHSDPGFGKKISWDVPLLEGYPIRVLNNERGQPLESWNSLHGAGVYKTIKSIRPNMVLMHSFGYRFNLAIYLSCLFLRIPLCIRMETQDDAFERRPLSAVVRSFIYKSLYRGIYKAFFIGELNKCHYIRHGLKEDQLIPARYCTPNRCKNLSYHEKHDLRAQTRASLQVNPNKHVVAFFGKLIPKKDPLLILQACELLPETLKGQIVILYVGSGELENELRIWASSHSIETRFTGFVNQSELTNYYLASDTVVLPSKRMGETWGLVVNEALQAGCSVVVSEAVGCHADFQTLERFKVIPEGGSSELAEAIDCLTRYPRSFDWAEPALEQYSIDAAAAAIAEQFLELSPEERVSVPVE